MRRPALKTKEGFRAGGSKFESDWDQTLKKNAAHKRRRRLEKEYIRDEQATT